MSRPKLAVASDIATVILAMAAVGVFGYRFFSSGTSTTGSGPVIELSRDAANAVLAGGAILGDSASPVKIAVFSDYQCPFCKVADERLRKLVRAHPGDLAVIVRQFPLGQLHPSARIEASAADCADKQGAFAKFHEALFADQTRLANATDSSLIALADSIGVPDKAIFAECLGSRESLARLAADSALGFRLGISGTPAILVDRALILGVPEERQFARVIDRLIEDTHRK